MDARNLGVSMGLIDKIITKVKEMTIQIPDISNAQLRSIAEGTAEEIEAADARLAQISVKLDELRNSKVSGKEVLDRIEAQLRHYREEMDVEIDEYLNKTAARIDKPSSNEIVDFIVTGRATNGVPTGSVGLLYLASEQLLLDAIKRRASVILKGNALTYDDRAAKIRALEDERMALEAERDDNLSVIRRLSGDTAWQPYPDTSIKPMTLDQE